MRTMPRQKPGESKQDYGTPPQLIRAVKDLLHVAEFDIDLAAHSANHKAPRWYTEKQNALEQPWKAGSGWNWLNPPFERIGPWVRKAWEEEQDHGTRTVVLVPVSGFASWWREWVHHKAHVILLAGRLTFEGTPINTRTGKQDCYPKDCALLLYGWKDQQWYRIWDWKKGQPT